LAKLAGVLAVLNLLDGVLTWVGLRLGAITEVNPLICWAWTVAPSVVIGLKTVGVSLLILALVPTAPLRWPVTAVKCLVAAYALLLPLHLRWITLFYLGSANIFHM
jgi:hypothetical protein